MTEVKTLKFRFWDPVFMGEYCSEGFHECCIRITEIVVSITQLDTNFPNFILRQELFTFYMETAKNFGLPVRSLSAVKFCDCKTKKIEFYFVLLLSFGPILLTLFLLLHCYIYQTIFFCVVIY